MGESIQDVYAKNLPTEFGYPLRIPEPSSNLPESHQENGLQIGDVGYVDRHGGFQVLFNIRYSPNHELHRKRRLPAGFEPIQFDDEAVNVNPDSISFRQFIGSPHIRHKPPEQPDERLLYRFVPSLPSGAILILPFGAVEHELNEDEMENFRNIAVEHAQSWCAEARRDSIYLITGFHKARSWSLGSFHNAPYDAEILVRQPNEHDEDAKIHQWAPNFSMYWRAGPRGTQSGNLNQTVFITGFKVTVRWWLPIPYVELLQRPSSTLFVFIRLLMMFLLRILKTLWLRISLKRHEHVPQLTPPFHPSDVINRYLLAKNPNAHVAVTHDRQWMSVFKMDELIRDGFTNEDCVWEVLSDTYISASENGVVWLEIKDDGGGVNTGSEAASSLEVSSLSPPSNLNFVSITGGTNKPRRKLDGFSLCTPSIDKPWIVISHIRADNIITGLRYRPVGFYVLVEFNGIRRKTKVRSVLVCESVIEWDDQIILFDDPSITVQLSLCMAFEFDQKLGGPKVLCTSDTTVGGLVGSTSLVHFSFGKEQFCSSLLITAERQYCPYLGAYSSYENTLLGEDQSSVMAHETDSGHEALFRYYEDYQAADLKKAIEHFERALNFCPPDHECRPSALFNLAAAKFGSCEASGKDTETAESIALYRQALEMRRAPHPDRPDTLLGLGQALLHRYRRQQNKESLPGELEKLMKEVKDTCPHGSHEHRAAILILQRYKRTRVRHIGTLAELDELILELDEAVRVPPQDYFDRPHRLENLGLALKRRFKMQGDPGQAHDLDQAIVNQEEAIRLLHERYPQRARHLQNLALSLQTRFLMLGNVHDIEEAIAKEREAIRLTPRDHPDRARRLDILQASLLARSARQGERSIEYIERAIVEQEEAVYCTPEDHPDRAATLHKLSQFLRSRFNKLRNFSDLAKSLAKQEEAVQLTPEEHADRAFRLDTLGSILRAIFDELGEIVYLEQAISSREEAVRLTPDDHPDRPRQLHNLAATLHSRFLSLGHINDLEQAIAIYEDAMRLTPEGHPDRPESLQILSASFLARFHVLGDFKDLERAIAKQEEVVRLTPADHPQFAVRMDTLKWLQG